MIKFEFMKRPDYIIVQVLDAEKTRGSFNVPLNEEELWKDVAEYVRVRQPSTSEIVTRIN